MKLYCKDGAVLATHGDDQMVPPSAYGEGVTIVVRAEGTDGLDRLGPPPEEGTFDRRPFAAPEVALEVRQAGAAAALADEATALRQRLSGASDPFKAAVYNQRAAYGRMILAGTASAAMLAVARSEAVRIGMAPNLDAADPATVAEVWGRLDERLALAAARIDAIEAEGATAIGRRRTAAGVAEALTEARAKLAGFAVQAGAET